jgi:hypothetical protein
MNSKSESCEILSTEWTKKGDDLAQVLAGTITLKDGKLMCRAEKGHENSLKSVKDNKSYIGDKEFDPDKDPEGWLKSLPHQYTGGFLRARLLRKGDRPWNRGGQADVLPGLN